MIEQWRWRWRIWRARHYVWAAYLAWQRLPNRRNEHAFDTAAGYLRRVEASRP